MTFCKVCGLWIDDKSAWENGEPDYCDKCKPASLLNKTISRIFTFSRAAFIRRKKESINAHQHQGAYKLPAIIRGVLLRLFR
jgi:hypothetical protein